jgi:hypothetical protein
LTPYGIIGVSYINLSGKDKEKASGVERRSGKEGFSSGCFIDAKCIYKLFEKL